METRFGHNASLSMKTVRFSNVVAQCGKPVVHLIFTEPSKDRELQSAIKGNRLMTVHQADIGSTADHGAVGFEPGTGRQFLLFPKSVRKFAGTRIVGIKYDLLATPVVPKSQRIRLLPPPKRRKADPQLTQTLAERFAEIAGKPVPKPLREKTKPAKRIAPRPAPLPKAPKAPSSKSSSATKPKPATPTPKKAEPQKAKPSTPPEMLAVHRTIRRALKLLEDGKTVAAFNLLKGLVPD
jgi:hypothetical protein